MSPSSRPSGPVRSAADEINEEIRRLWTGPGAHPTLPLSPEQRARYQHLLAQLRQVEHDGVTEAA
ncbi:hypothetical protein GCM10018980_52160 [Streptomyces capoamus]|uniref:Uncharacterized protein n=1 Tax=Streptomyces capoamus TaxID=68183 RepID=A0A919EZG4_9ACTN|nr:hypothetical protein [Streptomyces capoamus]GGW15702.1 hypothetical protein GCM10010501_28670 [Streptomyces libani subsp. rufus]GHG62301.1 hypothetical protein GCM10018980_52160 [Streptomyces capoamus]